MGDYIGKICPYCQTAFKEGDDIVVCSICEMPHHKDCWIENKACTTFGCTGTISNADEQTQEAIDGVIFCTSCGTKMRGTQKFCSNCGMPLVQKSDAPHYTVAAEPQPQQTYVPPQSPQQPAYTVTQQQTYTQPQQTYTPPQQTYTQPQQTYTPPQQTYASQSGFSGGATPNDQDMMTFLQKNQMYYMGEFAKVRASTNKISWNWCSFLFGAAWMGYRKMILPAIVWSLVCTIATAIHPIMSLVCWVVAGLFGNYAYMWYAEREIAKTAGMDPVTRNTTLASKGGVSVGMIFAVILISGVLSGMLL